ncbi:MAG: ABC transporter ATP-binding protein [Eubacterium sp.]|nr:ABC transporter ATP-binding protein [Eubacterium sp.]
MLLRFEDISKVYQNHGIQAEALKHVDLEIDVGESVAIMGASGSGKSTLLNIIGCMDKATEGEYYLNDINIRNYSDKKMAGLRNEVFGFVMQDFALIERCTVEKNVMLPLYYSKKHKKEKKRRVEEMLDKVGLLEKKQQLAMRLSGGQRQRVAIARALVNDASILLCDEPTGALDQKTGKEIIDIFSAVNRQGKTVILVTHDPNVAKSCHRVLTISDGEIVSEHLG